MGGRQTGKMWRWQAAGAGDPGRRQIPEYPPQCEGARKFSSAKGASTGRSWLWGREKVSSILTG